MLTSYSNYINFFLLLSSNVSNPSLITKKFLIFLIFNLITNFEQFEYIFFLFFPLIIILHRFDSFPRENRGKVNEGKVRNKKGRRGCSRDKMNISRAVMFAYDFHRVNHSMASIVLMATPRWNLLICKLDAKWIIDRDPTF